jgi:hypothetical protein
MKNVAIAGVVLMFFAATAAAGELSVSKSTLGSMGLASMQQMSDSEGLAVRGKGTFSNVWGGSHAEWSIATNSGGWWSSPSTTQVGLSENSYEAGASWLGAPTSAGGNSLSFAGVIAIDFAADSGPGPGMGGFLLQVHAAGGIAGGSANAFAN